MADDKKTVPFKVLEKGTPTVLEVKKGRKTFRIRVAVGAAEIFDQGVLNPLTGDPLFEIRVSAAVDSTPVEKSGRKK